MTKRLLVFVVLLGAATAYSLLVGNLYNGHVVEHIPVVVCDLEDSAPSREVIRSLHDVHTYDVSVVSSQDEGETLLNKRKAAAMVVVPPDFSLHLGRNEQAPVAVITDDTNTLQQNYTLTDIQTVLGTMNGVLAAEYYTIHGATYIPPAPIQMSLRISDNPTNSYALFYLYGVMLTAAQLGIMLAIAASVQSDKGTQYHTLQAIAVKELFYVILSLVSAAIGLSVLISLWYLPFKGSVFSFFVLYAVFALVISNMAVCIAMYFRTQIAMIQCLVFYALPAFLLAGYIWPVHAMIPLWKVFSAFIPLHYIMADFRSIALTGSVPGILQDMAVLGGAAVVLMGINAVFLMLQKHKRVSEKIA